MDFDFSNDIIEKFILKKTLVEKNWLNILSNIYTSLFLKNKNTKSLLKIDNTLFKNQTISLIIKLMITFYNKYNQCPNSKIIQLLAKKYFESNYNSNIKIEDISQLLLEISNMNYNINEEILSKNIKEFIRRSAFYETLNENIDKLTNNPDKYEQVVDDCLAQFDKVQKITFNDTDLGMNYFNEQEMEKHWEFIKNPEAKIHSGWEAFDLYTNGGFLKEGRMLALIMAQAGLGKSVFLSNLAVNFLRQNLSVVVISLEMSQDVYAQRFDAHLSENNINRLKENDKISIQKIKDFYKKYPNSNLIIKEYPPRSIRTHDIQTYLENLQNAGHKIDVIIVDYLNLVLPNRSTDSMYKDGLSVSEELRALSYIFHCPVISATQCNSEGMNSQTIDMQNVSESRGIVHTADFLAALMQKQEEREDGYINMRFLKNRLGGRVGSICKFIMDPETLVVNDITFDKNFNVKDNNNEEICNLINSQQNINYDISQIDN